MKYRILIETEKSGRQWYYVQTRWWRYFWRDQKSPRDLTMAKYRTAYASLEAAQQQIQQEVDAAYARERQKIVTVSVYDPNAK